MYGLILVFQQSFPCCSATVRAVLHLVLANEMMMMAMVLYSAADDLEYDDYIPQLPGSYFQMDPHAYTLTWSSRNNPPQHQRAS